MNRREYEYIQERLSRKMHDPAPKNREGWPMSQQSKEGYRRGIEVAKSLLSEIYHGQEDDK